MRNIKIIAMTVVLFFSAILALDVQNTSSAEAPEPSSETADKVQGGDVSPLEDLMREHGILRRILLIYEKELMELEKGEAPRYDVLYKAADMIHVFIEGYHEKLEEEHIFPVFEKAGKLADLIKALREQHKAGLTLTLTILRFSKEKRSASEGAPHALAENLRAFIKMYRPHAAREDTVLFPALKSYISGKEYDRLGDEFEDKEKELFGENGFEGKVKEVAELEKKLGIYEISRFTPVVFGERRSK